MYNAEMQPYTKQWAQECIFDLLPTDLFKVLSGKHGWKSLNQFGSQPIGNGFMFLVETVCCTFTPSLTVEGHDMVNVGRRNLVLGLLDFLGCGLGDVDCLVLELGDGLHGGIFEFDGPVREKIDRDSPKWACSTSPTTPV